MKCVTLSHDVDRLLQFVFSPFFLPKLPSVPFFLVSIPSLPPPLPVPILRFLCQLIMCCFDSLQRMNNLTMRKSTSSSKLKNCNHVYTATANLNTREHVDFILYSMSITFLTPLIFTVPSVRSCLCSC